MPVTHSREDDEEAVEYGFGIRREVWTGHMDLAVSVWMVVSAPRLDKTLTGRHGERWGPCKAGHEGTPVWWRRARDSRVLVTAPQPN